MDHSWVWLCIMMSPDDVQKNGDQEESERNIFEAETENCSQCLGKNNTVFALDVPCQLLLLNSNDASNNSYIGYFKD